MEALQQFWMLTAEDLLIQLRSTVDGLSTIEAQKRLKEQRAGQKLVKPWVGDLKLFLSQFKSPLILLLVFAVLLSIYLKEYSDSIIILAVLVTTGILGFVQERNAGRAVQKLVELVHSKASVFRDGKETEIPVDEVVPGDIVLLNAGDIIPADAFILEANDLHVNESALTGESFPAEKFAGSCDAKVLSKVTNAVFKGTSVINGTATILCVNTADEAELGKIASSLDKASALTAFEKGVIQFGNLLMRLTIIFTGIILILNIVFHRSFIESILFALALTVGLTPELLPAIMTITLAAGARRMASRKVIVKKLSAIQNLGAIDILCSDKTGTITEGIVKLNCSCDITGKENEKLLLYAYINASFETGFANPIDASIRQLPNIDYSGFIKCDEVPYDFIRKRLSIVVASGNVHTMITKGSVNNILEVCTGVASGSNVVLPIEQERQNILQQYDQFSNEGFRVIALCYKDVTGDPVINKDDERDMVFLGFLVFSDPLKSGVIGSIQKLREKGIALKIITGDNAIVARYLAKQIKLKHTEILKGPDVNNLTTEALQRKCREVDVFAEILPSQKERIVKAFQSSGSCVGYLGDGINDANALKAADVGISIQNAVDVAKEAADLVLLDQDINVINEGIDEGRKTFTNTLKYIFVTTSANFGNMFSMAIASLLLPFLPLLPVQILLNNFLSDLPAITIASDRVDDELVNAPKKWNISNIRRFMIVFGLQSSVFDFTTFGLLYYYFHATVKEFRTAWFIESLLTEILILLVIRTRRPFFKSRPSSYLLWASLFTFIVAVILPYLPFAQLFELAPLPLTVMVAIILVVFLYILVAEVSKKYLIRNN
ncbi:MAG TPA: magnesium-translocating P-type ATPase [Flavisolibacter sp.]|nr:magnesium-translocating P-type ATPase [Flavisolibacter sp.]